MKSISWLANGIILKLAEKFGLNIFLNFWRFMKKLLVIFCAIFLFSTAANATGFFVGGDALFSNARHQSKNSSQVSGPQNGNVKESNNPAYGVNAGYRFDLLALLVSGEIFYDRLNTSSKGFSLANGASNNNDSIELKDRYGAKANLGFAILPKVTPFLTYGLANVGYSNQVLSSSHSLAKSELTPLYGVGILFDLPFDISLKAAYDYQSFNTQYGDSSSKIRTHLGVARLGLIYNF